MRPLCYGHGEEPALACFSYAFEIHLSMFILDVYNKSNKSHVTKKSTIGNKAFSELSLISIRPHFFPHCDRSLQTLFSLWVMYSISVRPIIPFSEHANNSPETPFMLLCLLMLLLLRHFSHIPIFTRFLNEIF